MSSVEFFKDRLKSGQHDFELSVFRETLEDLICTPGRTIKDLIDLVEELSPRTYLHDGLINPDAEADKKKIEAVSKELLNRHAPITKRTYAEALREHIIRCIPSGDWVNCIKLKQDVKARFIKEFPNNVRSFDGNWGNIMPKLVTEGKVISEGEKTACHYRLP